MYAQTVLDALNEGVWCCFRVQKFIVLRIAERTFKTFPFFERTELIFFTDIVRLEIVLPHRHKISTATSLDFHNDTSFPFLTITYQLGCIEKT